MSGVLNVTVGDVEGRPTVVISMGGIHATGSEVEAVTLHVFEAVDRAMNELEKRGTPLDVIVMDGRLEQPEQAAAELPKKRGRKPKSVDKSA